MVKRYRISEGRVSTANTLRGRVEDAFRTTTRPWCVALSLVLAAALRPACAIGAPAGFEGFQLTPPYNTANPFNMADLEKISHGFQLFTTETFNGNGRVCSTCHIPEKNYNLSASDIAGLPAAEKQKVLGGTNTDLENGDIVETLGLFNIHQAFGLGTEGDTDTPEGPFRASMSIGGVGLATLNNFVCRPGNTTPCTPGSQLPTPNSNRTIDDGTRDIMLGWAGDGPLVAMFGYEPDAAAAPGNCEAVITDFAANVTDLEKAFNTFALAAVKTHFPKTQNRTPGVDFRCPTATELGDMSKFQRWLGRRFELDITKMTFSSPLAQEGRNLFSTRKATCVACHVNAGASDNQGRVKLFPVPFLKSDGSPDFDLNGNRDEPLEIVGANKTSRNGSPFFEPELDELVDAIISKPDSDLTDFSPFVPFDEGDGVLRSSGEPGFNVQSIVEAARKHQFFHNNAVEGSIEDAIAHYFTDKFDRSQGGGAVNSFRRDTVGVPIAGPVVLGQLGGTEAINKMGLFLRALSSIYALADCERFVNEMIDRVDFGLPTDLPERHCRFALNDVKHMLEGVKVGPNPYKDVPKQLALIEKKLERAVEGKHVKEPSHVNSTKGKLRGVRGSLQGLRTSIAETPELAELP